MCYVHPQAEAASATAGADPVIVRNAGSGGPRDLHLEDFSVSNGGPNLIEDASLMLAFGRRYGLVSLCSFVLRSHCPFSEPFGVCSNMHVRMARQPGRCWHWCCTRVELSTISAVWLQVGRNGTGKTTLLRALAGHQIKGIPATTQVLLLTSLLRFQPVVWNCAWRPYYSAQTWCSAAMTRNTLDDVQTVLHMHLASFCLPQLVPSCCLVHILQVEQEVVGDDRSVLQAGGSANSWPAGVCHVCADGMVSFCRFCTWSRRWLVMTARCCRRCWTATASAVRC